MIRLLILLTVVSLFINVLSFSKSSHLISKYKNKPKLSMSLDATLPMLPLMHDMIHHTLPALPHMLSTTTTAGTLPVGHEFELAIQGIADAVDATAAGTPICPNFGEPGWAPFCFLQGNPIFNAFDIFQGSIQNSIVTLHDTLQGIGIQNAYGISIILFTCLIRGVLFPVTFRQLESAEKTKALQPKIAEINEKYADDQNTKNQMIALLYQETEVNPLAGCLPAILQIPVFISLYRSFFNLAGKQLMAEPWLWIPNLEGPVFGERSMNWLTQGWVNNVPSLGWHDTLAYLTLPVLLVAAQAVSLNVLTPPSDDPEMQKTQRILKYLPLIIGYFSLSVPAALGVYWLTSNVLSTVITLGIRTYFKNNPESSNFDIDLDKLANNQFSAFTNPVWGYANSKEMYEEAQLNVRPPIQPRIPPDFA